MIKITINSCIKEIINKYSTNPIVVGSKENIEIMNEVERLENEIMFMTGRDIDYMTKFYENIMYFYSNNSAQYYVWILHRIKEKLLEGYTLYDIISFLQGNKYTSYRMEDNYMMSLSAEQMEAYNRIIGSYCVSKEEITDINIIVPNKVVEVTFADGKKEKMVCHEEDTFNLRNCLFIAIVKHLYKKDYTFEGIEWKAFELTHLKKYVKIVDSALKAHEKKQKDIAKLEKEHADRLEYAKARHERKLAKKAKKEQEEVDKQIAIQKEAYIQAMNYMEDSGNVVNN